jgi:hypothetical protein
MEVSSHLFSSTGLRTGIGAAQSGALIDKSSGVPGNAITSPGQTVASLTILAMTILAPIVYSFVVWLRLETP